jgi:hypothetical protein
MCTPLTLNPKPACFHLSSPSLTVSSHTNFNLVRRCAQFGASFELRAWVWGQLMRGRKHQARFRGSIHLFLQRNLLLLLLLLLLHLLRCP